MRKRNRVKSNLGRQWLTDRRRDFDLPEYKRWRAAVVARDGGKCRMPGCGSKNRVQAHHIDRWANNPHLRFDVQNGITLCHDCHKKVTREEERYSVLFRSILGKVKLVSIYKLLFAKKDDEELHGD